MHPRNKYNTNPPNFALLAEKYENFRRFVFQDKNGKSHINFKDPEAVRELTYTLLEEDFQLKLEIPLNSLCPMVTVRLNYVHWIEDLVHSNQTKDIRGIDIGTGHSCIYPLLACRLNPTWKFIATDIDPNSIEYSKKNVEMNNFQDRIQCIQNFDSNYLVLPFVQQDSRFDFCMCNPPFYENWSDVEASREFKEEEPASVCLGTSNEMITEGGEVGFVKKLIQESIILKDQIRWYTSKLGKRSSIKPLILELEKKLIKKHIVTEFQQGQTTRWGIAWSFSETISQDIETNKKRQRSFDGEITIETQDKNRVIEIIVSVLTQYQITFKISSDFTKIGGFAEMNTWNRKARRLANKKEKEVIVEGENEKLESFVINPFKLPISNTCLFAFEILILENVKGKSLTISTFWNGPFEENRKNDSKVTFQQFFQVFEKKIREYF